MKRVKHQALIAVYLVAVSSLSASANYIAAPVHDEFTVLTDKWELVEGSAGKPENAASQTSATHGRSVADSPKTYTLEVTYAGKKIHFPVDRFMLAHNTDSNTICTGSYLQFTENYLNELCQHKPRTDLLVTLGSIGSPTAPVSVTGVWSFDTPKAWDRAIQQGSRTLDLSAENVRKLGSAMNYREAIVKASELRWSKFLRQHPSQN